MCGIAAIIDLAGRPVYKEDVKIIMDKLRHRGPDAEGFYAENDFCLGHVRLSILDLSEAGTQPMTSYDGRYTITFNGEIYNYLELRGELESEYTFKTKTDTEVILNAFDKWGPSCLDKFNGDWSFIIYDCVKKKFFGARDRFGIKPLYYLNQDMKLMFASEIQAIIPLVKNPEPNDRIIYEYLVYNRTDQSNETFFNGIFKVPKAHYFTVSQGEIEFTKWYSIKDKVEEFEIEPKEYRKYLYDSIKLRLRSDVPIGISLSGGIDSSTITSVVLHDFNLSKIKTFSAVFKGHSADESQFILEYEKILSNMSFTTPDANSFFDDFRNFINAHGEPVASLGPYAQFKVMELAENEVKVTLDGQGADEMLAGYHYFFGAYLKELLLSGRLFKTLKEITWYCVKHQSFVALKYLIFYMLPENLKGKMGSKVYGCIDLNFENKWKKVSTLANDLYNPDTLNESLIQHFDYKLEHLLKWSDLNAMHYSIESRIPFLDHNLVERTLSLPAHNKIFKGQTKHILRESVKEILPKVISDRRDKKGFSTPSADWMRDEKFKNYLFELINSESFKSRKYFDSKRVNKKFSLHMSGKEDNTKDLWKIVNLEEWLREYID